jgi:hypothetical protein
MISVYGLRASILLWIVGRGFGFGKTHLGWDILYDVLFIIAGGFFYLIVSLTFHFINPIVILKFKLPKH